jgi:hypothetical protein
MSVSAVTIIMSEEEGTDVRGRERRKGNSTELHESERAARGAAAAAERATRDAPTAVERAARDAAAAASRLDVEPDAKRAARDAAAAATWAASRAIQFSIVATALMRSTRHGQD